MNIKSSLLTLISLFLFFFGAFAQDDAPPADYIVNMKNDTIKCEINMKFFTDTYASGPDNASQQYRYKVKGVRGSRMLNADSIKAYYYSGDTSFFVSKQVPGLSRNVFVKLLESGELSLYEFIVLEFRHGMYNTTETISHTFWYTFKNSNGAIKLVNADVVGIYEKRRPTSLLRQQREADFVDMIADNPGLLGVYKDARKSSDYNWELIRTNVKDYNAEYLESHKTSK